MYQFRLPDRRYRPSPVCQFEKSISLHQRAQGMLPGGVNSPVRDFSSVRASPLVIDHGDGAYLVDVDGNRLVDYVLSYGPLILGHAHRHVQDAITVTARSGTAFGATSRLEVELAQLIVSTIPGMEMIRFVNSGTEATMSAIRLARAFTGRDKIIKFGGNYHGHADAFLVRAGSGAMTLGLPDSLGVPSAAAADTLVIRYNDLAATKEVLNKHGESVAAVIIEPIAGNMGVVRPVEGFLQGLRRATEEVGALLIFDEVMTGYRVHQGGAQALYNVQADLVTLGKVIGGGFPVGAYGGRRDIMQMIAPSGPVYQAGTLSGNPVTMAAGIATLTTLLLPAVWERINSYAKMLVGGIREEAHDVGIPVTLVRAGTMFSCFFTDELVTDRDSAMRCDIERYAAVFRSLLEQGVLFPPSQFEACFLCSAHNSDVIERTLEAFAQALKKL